MKLLFVYSSLPLGGIETFIVRLSKIMHSQGFKIKILFFLKNFDNELIQELGKHAEIFIWDDYSPMCKVLGNNFPILKVLLPVNKNKIIKEIIGDITHIHAPDINSIIFANRLKRIKKHLIITTGVYHINEFNIFKFRKHLFGKILFNLLRKLPPENFIFFNEVSKSFYIKHLSHEIIKSLISPIGIDVQKYNKNIIGNQNKRIVSIGRLTSWKKYLVHIIHVIEELNTLGIQLTFDSYGDGSERDYLEKLVKQKGLEKQIFFHKSIDYTSFSEVIKNSIMFIGAGTALIEASACGIPALIGIENEESCVTYGFLHDLDTLSYQENDLEHERILIKDKIKFLLNMNENEYLTECLKARHRANDFSINKTLELFTYFLNSSVPADLKTSYYLDAVYILSLIKHLFSSKILGKYKLSFFERL